MKLENGKSDFAVDEEKMADTTCAKKKTDNDVEIVKIINVFKKIWTIAILMRKDVPNPGKLVWGPYDQPFLSNIDFSIDFGGKTCMKKPLCHFQNHILSLYRYNF